MTFISNNEQICASLKLTIAFCSIASLLQYHFHEPVFVQPSILALLLIGLIYFIIALNIQIFLELCRNIEIKKLLQLLRSTTNLCKFLTFGIIFVAISASSSSFIEEEHQIWYYLNNTLWIILYLIETKHLMNAKNLKITRYLRVENQLKWILLFVGHLIARRLNQTGDKWLNVPDIGDWFQMEQNRIWNSFFVSISLLLLYLTCMDFGSILTNVLTITACMLIYYYRTLNGSVYFAGIKATE